MSRRELLGIVFDDIELHCALEAALSLMTDGSGGYIVTPNPEMLYAARRDPALMQAIREADLVLPDGVGILLASRAAGSPIRHRLPGIDFASHLLSRMAMRNMSVYLLGAAPGTARRAALHLENQWPGLKVCGCHDGFFTAREEERLAAEIRSASPDLLAVCLGSPKQELWMHRYRQALPRVLMIGLGGALDVYAGNVKRAPALWRRFGLEWLYRLLRQPRRWKRVLHLPWILPAAFIERFRSKTNEQG